MDPGQARRLWRVYEKLTGRDDPFEDVVYDGKRLIMQTAMASELNVLAHVLDGIGEGSRRSRDFTLETCATRSPKSSPAFPVYRTYVDRQRLEPGRPQGRRARDCACAPPQSRPWNDRCSTSSAKSCFRATWTPNRTAHERRGGFPPASADDARERLRFAMKLQQYTGPVQAKGLEDTAFYRYNVLLSLNEVGGEPTRIGRTVEEFHARQRQRGWRSGRSRCWRRRRTTPSWARTSARA